MVEAGIGRRDRLGARSRAGDLDRNPLGGQRLRNLGHQSSSERGPSRLAVHLGSVRGTPGKPGIDRLARPRQIPVHGDIACDDHAARRGGRELRCGRGFPGGLGPRVCALLHVAHVSLPLPARGVGGTSLHSLARSGPAVDIARQFIEARKSTVDPMA